MRVFLVCFGGLYLDSVLRLFKVVCAFMATVRLECGSWVILVSDGDYHVSGLRYRRERFAYVVNGIGEHEQAMPGWGD